MAAAVVKSCVCVKMWLEMLEQLLFFPSILTISRRHHKCQMTSREFSLFFLHRIARLPTDEWMDFFSRRNPIRFRQFIMHFEWCVCYARAMPLKFEEKVKNYLYSELIYIFLTSENHSRTTNERTIFRIYRPCRLPSMTTTATTATTAHTTFSSNLHISCYLSIPDFSSFISRSPLFWLFI